MKHFTAGLKPPVGKVEHTIVLRTVKVEARRITVPHSFAELVSGRPTTGRTKPERMKKSTLQCARLLLSPFSAQWYEVEHAMFPRSQMHGI